ncbi:unannotated protein [freshwater metagenome]|uniref:Unannotated protein n=1 Tax=freshwater metagenome TaxID=449393 RepID=A0A6J6CG83_9ZZZZ|nr:hypothetical protein [Actinomycetota bacterium]MTA92840.1 hypothetical protein [Actinomycetota bacterium]
MKQTSLCAWSERVSSLLDGELPDAEQELVRTHVRTCPTCTQLINANDTMTKTAPTSSPTARTDFLHLIQQRPSPLLRVLLLLVGGFILANSAPLFVRGNTSGDALHDLRHLAIWQAAIGVAVLSSAITFRISRILTVMLGTFLVLTAIASIYDIATGHRGPWTDYMHVLEVLAVLLVLKLIWPQLQLLSRRRQN